jgi:hypothetical protein
MLVEHNPTDERFEELLGYFPELSVELRRSMPVWRMRSGTG